MYVSYYVDAASGATIVLVAAAVFILVFGLTALLNRRRLTRVGSELHAETAEGAPVFDLH
jgi:nitrate reductase gamma subunit